MKILIVVPAFDNGGTITSLKNILPKIDRERCEIDVFPITNSGPNYDSVAQFAHIIGERIDGKETDTYSFKETAYRSAFKIVKSFKKLLCGFGYDPSLLFFRKVVKKLQKNKYEEVIAFQEGQATRFVGLFSGVRKVAWVRCDYSKIGEDVINTDIKEETYSKIDRIICVSDYTRSMFIKTITSVGHKTIAIHNLISIKTIVNKGGLVPDDVSFDNCLSLRFVSIGRLAPVKQFSLIPEIAYSLKKKGLDFCWFIIGGDDSDKELIELNIEKYDVADCVKLLGNKNNPYPYIKKADALVCTSLSEACPNVLNEAKILGTPIVSTQFGSVGEMMTDGVEGLVTSIEKMDEAIFRLFEEEGLYKKIKANLSNYRYDNNLILEKLNKETSLRFYNEK